MSVVVPLLPSTAADGDIIRQAMLYRAKLARLGCEIPARVIVPLRAPALFKGDAECVEVKVVFYGDGARVERPEPAEGWR